MGRRLQVAVVFCMLLLVGHSVLANSPSGSAVFTQDWAYSAIEELGRDRDIPGFDIPADPNRNQGALLVARLLQHLSGEDHLQSRRFGVSKNVYLDSMIFSYNQRVIPEKALTASQVETLYRLVLEFSDELEILGYAIQDFNLLQAQGFIEQQGGLFADRNLLYSEQALSAARKRDEQRTMHSVEPVTPPEPRIAEIVPEPVQPRNLWTGQFSPVTRLLPAASSFVARQLPPEQNLPISLGGVEVTGALRPAPAGSQASLESSSSITTEGAGYGISLRMGDVALRTDLALDPQKVSTSVDLSWGWADLFTVSAGYRQGLRLREDVKLDEETAPLVASLGVMVPINRGQVHLGMTQEWNFSELEGNSLRPGELDMGASTAELGLSYDLQNDSSLRFNYRFIDFSDIEESGTEAEAAFSIKF